MDYLELAVAVRPQAVETAADLLCRHVPAGVSIEPPFDALDEEGAVAYPLEAPVRLRAWLPADGAPAEAALRVLRRDLRSLGDGLAGRVRTRRVSDASWADGWKRYFPVLRVGQRLVIKPSWRRSRPRKGDVIIELDPGMAFGTGQHPTTRLCLEVLEARLQTGSLVLDVGSGSGILAIAAARLGAARVDALDIDSAAVRATVENAERNGVACLVRAAQGSLGADWPFPEAAAGRYDLALANLSSRAVQELARPLVEALRPGGVAVVSGISAGQEAASRATLEAAGGRLLGMRVDGDWHLLLLERGAAPPDEEVVEKGRAVLPAHPPSRNIESGGHPQTPAKGAPPLWTPRFTTSSESDGMASHDLGTP